MLTSHGRLGDGCVQTDTAWVYQTDRWNHDHHFRYLHTHAKVDRGLQPMAIPSGAVLTNDRCLNCLPLTIAIAVFSCGCQQQKTRIPWRKTRYLQTKQQRPSLTSHPFQSPTQRAAEPLLTAHCSLCIQAIDAGERRRFPLCVLREKVHRAGRASLRTENCAKKIHAIAINT